MLSWSLSRVKVVSFVQTQLSRSPSEVWRYVWQMMQRASRQGAARPPRKGWRAQAMPAALASAHAKPLATSLGCSKTSYGRMSSLLSFHMSGVLFILACGLFIVTKGLRI